MSHEIFMKRAMALAKSGQGNVSPNPMVGAVIVKDGIMIGEGYHKKYGDPHAEINAINDAKKAELKGATMYVTLEPCCHYGKTPPCTEAIINSGIKTVYVGVKDPNEKVAGKGIDILKKNNIHVVEGLLQKDCEKINEVFFHYTKTGMPYVIMKYAMTTDGKIATYTGQSKWITSEKTRQHSNAVRGNVDAIIVGIGTVLADDPMLTCRVGNKKSPVRVICDSSLKIPLSSNIVRSADKYKTIIATLSKDMKKRKQLQEKNVSIIDAEDKGGLVDMKDLMIRLGKQNISSILAEGGGKVNYSLLEEGLVNKLHVYIGSKLFGGSESLSPVEGAGIKSIDNAFEAKISRIEQIAGDIFLEYYLEV